MLTRASSNVPSRAIMPLSSRLTTSLTRNCRCFIERKWSSGVMEQWSNGRLNTPTLHYSVILKFLRNRFELVTFDNVADLIFAEVAQLDAAFQPGPHFLQIGRAS